ncbi:MAG: Panacea domain-containing protein [Planctomycetaceae bacterium]
MRLLKILYIASRKALEQSGKPIIGGSASALENGPLHSEIYDQIRGTAPDAQWRCYFRNSGHTVELLSDPGRLDLSPFEIDILQETAEWAEQFETFELSRWTHDNLFEYQKNEPAAGGSNPIVVNDILEALHFTEVEMQGVMDNHHAHSSLLSSLERVK